MKRFLTLTLLAALVLTSCDLERKRAEKDIARRFSHIETLLNDRALQSARLELDSIHLLYPRMVDARRQAKALGDTITLWENLRTMAYCDSLLPIKQHQADSIKRLFRYERDEAYEDAGHYVYRALRIEANVDRTYLRAYVDDNADFYLISNFTADYALHHTCVKASVGDTYATTDSIDTGSPLNHAFDDGGMHWEIVTFRNEVAGNVPVFIAQYAGERIKITLQGGRSRYSFYLTDTDKKALAETYNLWVAMKDVALLQQELRKAQATIRRIES